MRTETFNRGATAVLPANSCDRQDVPLNRMRVYRCAICDTTVEVLEQWGAELTCCGRCMEPAVEHSWGDGDDDHVPVIETTAAGVWVHVGADHPMDDDHRILWIELLADGRCSRQHLEPGQAPQASFDFRGRDMIARAYCNVNGLWVSHYSQGQVQRRRSSGAIARC